MGPDLVTVSIGALGLAAGLGAWILRARQRARTAPAEDAQADLKALKRGLSRAQYLEHVDTRMAETALHQFEQGEERYGHFLSRLEAKFERTELTFGRYVSAAEQVHQAMLQNLREVEALLKHLDSLHAPHTMREIEKLRAAQGLDEAMAERLRRSAETETKIRAHLTYNDRALNELDRVIVAVSDIKTSKDTPGVDLEAAMDELRELAARAKKYSQ